MTESRNSIHFLLVPDSGAARRLRRELAQESARSGVLVGVWQELLSLAGDNYLLNITEDSWQDTLHDALQRVPGAFWVESYEAAPSETAGVIETAYGELVTALPFEEDLRSIAELEHSPRGGTHVSDLLELHDVLSGELPRDLWLTKALLSTPSDGGLRDLRVYSEEGFPKLSAWQVSLVEMLNARCSIDIDTALQSQLVQIQLSGSPSAAGQSAFAQLKRYLFSGAGEKYESDSSVQWLSVRDFLEEAEVAAGMVQEMLRADPNLEPCKIGILIPEAFEYETALEDAFALAGLPIAGLPRERWRRDLGREVLYHFLNCRQKPAPAMAVACCLSSPLMPWNRATGAFLAQRVMDGDWTLKPPAGATDAVQSMLALLSHGDKTASGLASAVRQFLELLDGREEFDDDLVRAKVAGEDLLVLLEQDEEIEWQALKRQISPAYLPSGQAPEFSQEGVTLWREGVEPWRAVDHLLVLGFAAGHYPSRMGSSAIFSGEDLEAMVEGGLALDTPRTRLKRARALFLRQLRSANHTATFLIPRRDAAGDPRSPSESLIFMLQLFGLDEEKVPSLDILADRSAVQFIAEMSEVQVIPPVLSCTGDPDLGTSLLELRRDAEGNPKPESPSALEKLMVSPLAWLLQRLHAEPLLWAPEGADVRLLGSISHRVFEFLYAPDKPIPEPKDIPKLVEDTLERVVATMAPFLTTAPWQVEMRLLCTELTRAALTWHDVLSGLDAEVLGTEISLQGNLDKLPVQGQADVILGLPNNRLLVVDYKKSSASGRRKRMEKGYESQVNLYRIMLETGGLKDEDKRDLDKQLRSSQQTGIVYFTMNDATSLTDSPMPDSASVPGWDLVEGDLSSEAMTLIRKRITELRKGKLHLNRADDQEFFDKHAGVHPYALEVSPLTSVFMLPAEEERS